MQYAWEKRECIENFGWTRLEERDHLEELFSWEGGNVMDVLETVWQRCLDSSGSGQTIDGLLETW